MKEAIFKDYVGDYSLELGLKEATVRGKRDTLKRMTAFMDSKVFNADNCREWLRELNKQGWKPVSIKHEVRILRATIKFLFKRGFIDNDFSSLIPYPKVHKKPLEIVPAELAENIIIAGTESGLGDNSINKERKEEHRQALRFILRTGLRNRELRDLKGNDVNLEEETFFVKSKGRDIDVLPIPKDMLGELKKRKDKIQLFEVRAETLNRCLKRGCERLGIKKKIRTHSLRHIFCTSLLKRGVPYQEVSRLMRHASVVITDKVYSHYNIEDLRLSLNSRHPLIVGNLPTGDVFDMLEEIVETVGVKNDKRFSVELERAMKSISIRVKEI